jgi:hypothetical protein
MHISRSPPETVTQGNPDPGQGGIWKIIRTGNVDKENCDWIVSKTDHIEKFRSCFSSDIESLRGRQAPAIHGTLFLLFGCWMRDARPNATLLYVELAHDRSRIDKMPAILKRAEGWWLWVCITNPPRSKGSSRVKLHAVVNCPRSAIFVPNNKTERWWMW